MKISEITGYPFDAKFTRRKWKMSNLNYTKDRLIDLSRWANDKELIGFKILEFIVEDANASDWEEVK